MAEVKLQDPLADQLRRDYPPNSKLKGPEEDRPQLEKVTSGEVSVVKDSIGRRFAKIFFAEDVKNVKKYLIYDVLIPGVKMAFMSTLDMLLFAKVGGSYLSNGRFDYSRASTSTKPTRYTYTSTPSSNRTQAVYADPANAGGNLRPIMFKTRVDAEHVLGAMLEQAQVYGEVTVMQYYDLCGVDSNFADDKWGWKNIGTVRIQTGRGGYILTLPSPQYLD